MGEIALIIGLIALFIAIGGVFAAAEIALVSLRESQLAALEKRSARGARVAALARDPNTFLAAVQIGVTLSGFLSAAYGATALAPYLTPTLVDAGIAEPVAAAIAIVTMTLIVAYASLVFGELAPKRLALQRAESFALVVTPVLAGFAVAVKPLVWLLAASSNLIVRLFGGDPHQRAEQMSDDELRELVDAHDGLGDEEREIVGDVLHAADRTLAEVMRHRADMVAIRGDLSLDEARQWAREQPYSRYPVLHSGVDEITTFVHVRDLAWAPEGTDLASIERPLAGLPATARILPTLTLMRREGDHIALVVDEYGGVDGIVTLEDIVEELIGEVYDEYDDDAHDDHNATGSAQLVAGSLTIEEFADRTGFVVDDGPFETIAGYVIDRLGRMPLDGDTVETADARLTVRGVERRRIAQIEVERLATSPS
ncbi:MAG: hypothetical protein C0444_03895 [Microbacterium sp.]|nr:hypothetical protein [Microbacterium sp.]MBA4346969.1 hypothetical protein [Microbacterium sp.]